MQLRSGARQGYDCSLSPRRSLSPHREHAEMGQRGRSPCARRSLSPHNVHLSPRQRGRSPSRNQSTRRGRSPAPSSSPLGVERTSRRSKNRPRRRSSASRAVRAKKREITGQRQKALRRVQELTGARHFSLDK